MFKLSECCLRNGFNCFLFISGSSESAFWFFFVACETRKGTFQELFSFVSHFAVKYSKNKEKVIKFACLKEFWSQQNSTECTITTKSKQIRQQNILKIQYHVSVYLRKTMKTD